MTTNGELLHETLMLLESPKGIASCIEPALDIARLNIRRLPEKDQAEAHSKLRTAYAGIDRLRSMK